VKHSGTIIVPSPLVKSSGLKKKKGWAVGGGKVLSIVPVVKGSGVEFM